MIYKKFVITGTGRSGTRYAAELFSASGLVCGHQKVFTFESHRHDPEWGDYRGDASAFAAPFALEIAEDVLIIHQVRNPALVINSLIINNHVRSPYYARYVAPPGTLSEHHQAAALWARWNKLVLAARERPNYVLMRLEDYTPEFVLGVGDAMGETLDKAVVAEAFKKQRKDTGTRGTGAATTPADLSKLVGHIGKELHEVARACGYLREPR